ncbi:hypothetical protein PPERSA_09873 [Pseudocohnilembus persalinus]|uniref:Uncharacterized protein n=1 Tax=Pseudocohnilembus persalinus TaxID=266149 RepID=A0A0V0QV44_PSEPJ|nr:hypothetical protein PPERSA_09873 [Pseudocohnilembus persalinus]|eukprot:KRX05733.1 hypothetical protein PPERSA_09873 [Pseudocohnilembus persalinus]
MKGMQSNFIFSQKHGSFEDKITKQNNDAFKNSEQSSQKLNNSYHQLLTPKNSQDSKSILQIQKYSQQSVDDNKKNLEQQSSFDYSFEEDTVICQEYKKNTEKRINTKNQIDKDNNGDQQYQFSKMSNLKDEIYYDNNEFEIKIHTYLDNLGLKLVDPIEKFHNYFDDKRTQIIATERYSQNSSPKTVSPLQNRYLIKKKNREQKKDLVPLSISINNMDKIKSCQSWKDTYNENVFSYNNIIKYDNENQNNDANKNKQEIQPNSLTNNGENGNDNLNINKFALKKYNSNFVNSEHKMYIQKLNLQTQKNQQIVEKNLQNSLQKYLIPKEKPDQCDMDCMEQQEEERNLEERQKV